MAESEFLLQLNMIARIDDLERGMKEAEKTVEKSSKKMEEATKDASEGGLEPMLAAIGKFAAGLFLAEAAFKIGSASMRAFAGDTEAAAAALMSIPVLGPLITGMIEFGESIEYASDAAFAARNKLAQLEEQAKSLDATVSILSTQIDGFAATQRLLGTDEFTIAEANFKRELERIEATKKANLRAIDEDRKASIDALDEKHLTYEDEQALIKEINDRRREQIRAEELSAENAKRVLELTMKKLKSEKESADLAKEEERRAQRQAELDAKAEEHEKFMLQLGEEQKKKEEERKKAEAERLKIDQQRLVLVNKIKTAEDEITKAKAEAQRNMSRATATFGTAGGSFTAGVSAQLNEAKLLTKVSTQSKQLLEQIVRNTANFGVSLI